MSASRYPIAGAALAWAVLLTPGPRADAADEAATVRGRVTLDGKPLAEGRILFHIGDDQFVGAKLNKDGGFAVTRVPSGRHKVTVEARGVPARYSSEEE